MSRHLLMRLQAPLMAFGGETIDNYGVIREFPALSMITGLLANALGWRREESERHDRLQSRLIVGARLDSDVQRMREYQTAQLFEKDQGWTTFGQPEGRAASPSYSMQPDGRKSLTWQRYRDYHASLNVLVALRLESADESPTLGELADALDRPARPLFIGRKSCLPSCRVFAGWQEADNMLHALQTAQLPDLDLRFRLQWPDGEGTLAGDRRIDLCDERNWVSGVHGGWRPVREGSFTASGVRQ
ncbi:type I-E CRISPR-associated protein Cas5/CasD [Aromatoleum bremense]|uniref:Type I-E CRISPR-associated protein Cas5/CasD n=1 Tax=Aromatoleum bremense TaxID=76115 RepID=A0ABX1NZD3_9RHOO|nr:type I-E CRISPR-associated protein Cas5/CasD [Aromatoleum bremense]NMG17376.1 type I-E CRISPR-associated protein Cas5/CasD [Aromatoleum bremense]QTQ31967.1 CRISPR system cascade, subunit Cas5 [Aromatoleum bremense]